MGCENLIGLYRTVTGVLEELDKKPKPEIEKRVQIAYRSGSLHAASWIEAIECASGWKVEKTEYSEPDWSVERFLVFDGEGGTAAEALFLFKAFSFAMSGGFNSDVARGGVDYNSEVPPGFDRLPRLPLVYIAEAAAGKKK